MNPADQWYYLEGAETRGPVSAAEIARMIQAHQLDPATQVAQAGWPQWSPASAALSHLLAPPQQQAAPEPAVYAIKVQCVSGPDQGKAYMIGAAEVALGRASGIGMNDPSIAENHVALSWQNNVLHFRIMGNAKLKVGGQDVTSGTLSNGQQFTLGMSTWQVGTAPVELSNMIGSLASRLSKLTATEKLEGFSLTGMFSEVFKGRKPGEIEDYFVVGTTKTTPPLDEVQTGWPKPWVFMRVLIFMLAVYFIFSKSIGFFGNPHEVPGLMVIGSLAVPLATAILFWELNTPRNVSFIQILMAICLGGVLALLGADIAGNISHLGWMGDSAAGIEEETVKLLAVILVARNLKYKYVLNGIVFGAAIGCGFAAFETAGYSFFDGFLVGYMKDGVLPNLTPISNIKTMQQLEVVIFKLCNIGGYEPMFGSLALRAYLAPFGHIVWTAITAGALWRVKGGNPFRIGMLFKGKFLRVFIVPVVLHALWDSPLVENHDEITRDLLFVLLGVIGWYVAFLLVQEGLRQIKTEQLTHTQNELNKTRNVLTTTTMRLRAIGSRPG